MKRPLSQYCPELERSDEKVVPFNFYDMYECQSCKFSTGYALAVQSTWRSLNQRLGYFNDKSIFLQKLHSFFTSSSLIDKNTYPVSLNWSGLKWEWLCFENNGLPSAKNRKILLWIWKHISYGTSIYKYDLCPWMVHCWTCVSLNVERKPKLFCLTRSCFSLMNEFPVITSIHVKWNVVTIG